MRAPTSDEVKTEVSAICKSEPFARSPLSKKLLWYVVEETLQDPLRNPQIKGMTIGIVVLEKADYDTKKHGAVKAAMSDLRDRLDLYNKGEGCNDRVRIEITPGSYVPRFTLNLPFPPLEMDAQALHYVSLARLGMDERNSGAELVPGVVVGNIDEKYPDHPQLLSLRAMQHAVNATYDGHQTPRESLRKAESLIGKIREQNAELWECTVTDAWIKATLYWEWEKADSLFGRAIAANPEAKICHQWYPFFLASQGKLEEAEAVLQEAVSHAAYDRPVTRADLAFFQILLGKLDDAQETLRGVMPLVKHMVNMADFPIGYGQAALLAAVRGDFKGAISNLISGEIKLNHVFLGFYSLFVGSLGARDLAKEAYEELKATFFEGSSLPLAFAALGIGEKDLAVKWLIRAAVSDRDPWTLLAAVHPLLQPLHDHPEFKSLIKDKMKLPLPPKS